MTGAHRLPWEEGQANTWSRSISSARQAVTTGVSEATQAVTEGLDQAGQAVRDVVSTVRDWLNNPWG